MNSHNIDTIIILRNGDIGFIDINEDKNQNQLLRELGQTEKYPYFSKKEKGIITLKRNYYKIYGTKLYGAYDSFSYDTDDFNEQYNIKPSIQQSIILGKINIQ